MSEIATGNNWSCNSKVILKHVTGCKKYTVYKKNK